VDSYYRAGAWSAATVADLVARNAAKGGTAFIAPDATLSWAAYSNLSGRLAAAYLSRGLRPGDRVAVLLTGGALTHIAYLAAQKAGLVTVGLGPRAGDAEIAHLVALTGAAALVTRAVHRGRSGAVIAARSGAPRHLTLDLVDDTLWLDGRPVPDSEWDGPGLGPDDLFFLNSTSGTTGRPKCVRQTMNVRKYFGPLAAAAGEFRPDDVVASLLPAPYGFGLWSAHIVPAQYRLPTVLVDEFDAASAVRLIERYRVTVLAAVTSQFVMMLQTPEFASADLSSLRVLFTGGERVPYQRAVELEKRTGCAVLQFYGSNEAGPISVTSVSDPPERRLRTGGRPIPAMTVRLFAPSGEDVTASGGPGQVAVRGPGCTPGYYQDPEANAVLFRPGGWMLTGDIATIADGYLTVTGRAADFIIRGGHNVSAPAVEEWISAHPRVAQVAVVGVPDETLGERVCAFVVTLDGGDLTLPELRAHLAALGVGKQNWPELVFVRAELPLGTGGKVDKASLRTLALRTARA
jgi:acyl-CoA synthetase